MLTYDLLLLYSKEHLILNDDIMVILLRKSLNLIIINYLYII